MSARRIFSSFILIVTLITVCVSPCFAGIKERDKVEQAILTLDEIMAIPEKGIPPTLLANAEAIAIIPNVIKAGVVTSARSGRIAVSCSGAG